MATQGSGPNLPQTDVTQAPVRLMIVDDHAVSRLGLRRFLELHKEMAVVGETGTGSEALALYRQCRPDVVLMDVRMAGVDGLAATHTICSADPDARICVVSSTESLREIALALETGALGFVTKEAGPAELLEAIREVAAGRQYLAPGVRQRLETLALADPLNVREKQILRLMVAGSALPEIAERTSLSAGTVKVYICHILAKLKVKNRAEAVFEATRRGLVRRVD